MIDELFLDSHMWNFYKKNYRDFGEVLVAMEREGFFVRVDQLAEAEKVAQRDKETAENVFKSWAMDQCADCRFMNVNRSLVVI